MHGVLFVKDDTNGVEIHDNHPEWEIFSGRAPSPAND